MSILLIDFDVTGKRESAAGQKIAWRARALGLKARQADPLYCSPNLCATAQQEDQQQNRDWNPQEPKQNVPHRALFVQSLDEFHTSFSNEFGRDGESECVPRARACLHVI